MESSAAMKCPAVGMLLLALFWSHAAGLTDEELETLEVLVSSMSTSLAQASWRSRTSYGVKLDVGVIPGVDSDTKASMTMDHSIRAREGVISGFDGYTKEEVVWEGQVPLTIVLEMSRQNVDDDEDPWIRSNVTADLTTNVTAADLGIPSGWLRLSEADDVELMREMALPALLFNNPNFALNLSALVGSINRITEVAELDGEVLDGVETRVISMKVSPNLNDTQGLTGNPGDDLNGRIIELAAAHSVLDLSILPGQNKEPMQMKWWIHSEKDWLIRVEVRLASTASPAQEGDFLWEFFDYNKAVTIAGPLGTNEPAVECFELTDPTEMLQCVLKYSEG